VVVGKATDRKRVAGEGGGKLKSKSRRRGSGGAADVAATNEWGRWSRSRPQGISVDLVYTRDMDLQFFFQVLKEGYVLGIN